MQGDREIDRQTGKQRGHMLACCLSLRVGKRKPPSSPSPQPPLLMTLQPVLTREPSVTEYMIKSIHEINEAADRKRTQSTIQAINEINETGE